MPHISIVTLGVADVARARAFYEVLGWRASSSSQDEIAFMQGTNVALALFGSSDLAEDAGVSPDGHGFGHIALAMNLPAEDAVDEALAAAERAGGTITKGAQATEWGGYSGYVADPDGHLWEVAHNPFFDLAEDGSVALPK